MIVIGGAGVFGSRLCMALAGESGVDLVVAGRDLARAEELAARIGARAMRLGRGDPGLARLLLADAPFVVIDAAGPFQPDADKGYPVARAALTAGAHYLDLSDDAGFTAGISALDDEAQGRGLVCLSGVSSVPALSAAAVRGLSDGMADIHLIDTVILPGNRAPRGLSVIAAILAQAGRPVPVWQGGQTVTEPGWGWPARIDIGFGRRRASVIGAPDAMLFPKAFAARSVRFRAGLELSVMHLGLWALSLPVRVGLLRSLVPLARPLRWVADRLKPFGTDRGGMRVRVAGITDGGRAECRNWVLEAGAGDGPEVPAIPARALVAALRAGTVAPGARACLTELDLAEAEALMARHRITVRREAARFPLLFDAAVEMGMLPAELQDLHRVIDVRRWSGRASIDRGEGVLSRLAGRFTRFPPAGRDVPVTVTMERQGETELWTRAFGPRRFRSRLSRPRRGTGLIERFGVLAFRIALRAEGGRLHYPVVQGWWFGVPLPRWALPVSRTAEAVDEKGRVTFDVELSHPLTGLIVLYRGWLQDASIPEIPAVLDLVPGPDDLLQPVLVGPVAAVHVGVQVLHQALVLLADFGPRPGVARVEDFQSLAFGRRQLAPRLTARIPLVLRRVRAQNLHRVVNAQARPGPVLGPLLAEGLRLSPPDAVGIGQLAEFLFRGTIEEVPFQIVLAHMVFAEPQIFIQMVRRPRCAVLPRQRAARVVALPRRGLERAGHATLALRRLLLGRGCGNVEAERIVSGHEGLGSGRLHFDSGSGSVGNSSGL